jgi:hypothetical protein
MYKYLFFTSFTPDITTITPYFLERKKVFYSLEGGGRSYVEKEPLHDIMFTRNLSWFLEF